jgi:hypothetical protein
MVLDRRGWVGWNATRREAADGGDSPGGGRLVCCAPATAVVVVSANASGTSFPATGKEARLFGQRGVRVVSLGRTGSHLNSRLRATAVEVSEGLRFALLLNEA